MASRRRIGVESSQTRALLLGAAEQVMREEGYAAVTTRRLASHMGVSNQLVHYYFRTMDDLFLALMRRGMERNIARLKEALAAPEPLRALWTLYSDQAAARLQIEFIALLNHRKAISNEAARSAEEMRVLEAETLGRVFREAGYSTEAYPPTGLALLMSSIPRIMMIEAALGISLGHAEVTAVVDRFLQTLGDATRQQQTPVRKSTQSKRPNAEKKKQR
jgi:AcrR family transcriptional regulator